MSQYTASLTVSVLKQHSCVNCGAVFRYVMTRDIEGAGGSEEKAQQNLASKIETTTQREVDMHPCPTCGMVQPEMVGAARKPSHYWQAFFVALVVGVLAILAGMDLIHNATGVWIGLVCYGLLAWRIFKTAASNPNLEREAQQALAQDELAADIVAIDNPGNLEKARYADPALATDGKHPMITGLLGAVMLLCMMAEVLRMTSGAPVNDRWYPAVVGPGDTATYYFDKEITSIKGYWKGKVAARISNAKALGFNKPLPCTATTKDKQWGNSINDVKSSEEQQSSTIYAEITIPAEAKLAGKKVNLQARVIYRFPQMEGGSRFREAAGKLEETTTLELAGPGAGAAYTRNFWVGVIGGGLLLFFACIWLGRRAGKLDGNPRETYAIITDDEEGEDQGEDEGADEAGEDEPAGEADAEGDT